MVALVHDHPSIAKDVADACMRVRTSNVKLVGGLYGCDDGFISDMIKSHLSLRARSDRITEKKKEKEKDEEKEEKEEESEEQRYAAKRKEEKKESEEEKANTAAEVARLKAILAAQEEEEDDLYSDELAEELIALLNSGGAIDTLNALNAARAVRGVLLGAGRGVRHALVRYIAVPRGMNSPYCERRHDLMKQYVCERESVIGNQ